MKDDTAPQATPQETRLTGQAHQDTAHDSAVKHVTGQAGYTDDLTEPMGTIHAYLGLSQCAHGRIRSMDFTDTLAHPGVLGVLSAADLAGVNDVSPAGHGDDPILADGLVRFWGQPVFAVIATTRDQARRAAHQARIDYDPLPHVLDPIAARDAAARKGDRSDAAARDEDRGDAAAGKGAAQTGAAQTGAAQTGAAQTGAAQTEAAQTGGAQDDDKGYVTPPLTLRRGDAPAAMARAPHRITGRFTIGGQDHFYLEGQIALAIPGEDDEMVLHVSTQHPSEVQHMVAHVLGAPAHAVVVNVRRMGGGFGGKETQMNLFACIAAVAARRWNRAVKIRPDRDDDMTATGKRHDFVVDYAVGFDDQGRILAVEGDWYARCGFSADLSGPVTDRALFHADNAYFYPDVRLSSHPMRTNTVSNTAFRGFGGPQGVIVAERMIADIAHALDLDPLEVRKRNLYQNGQLTPYHQPVTDQILPRIFAELEVSSDYPARRRAVLDWNARMNACGGVIRKGIALVPVKFGISFTATHFNQAGALIHVYADGSIQLNHGGTEMGQGLNTKVAQIVAEAFQCDLSRIKITRTTTEKVPNTSATAASSGTDLNGMAALDAADQIKARLVDFVAGRWQVAPDRVAFLPGHIRAGDHLIPFDQVIKAAYMARIHLSAAGFYKTPEIHWDRATGQGRPFYYYAYGAAVAEVSVDTLTGEYVTERVDILHDAGRSLNPVIDKGQVEGAFVQGAGWLTTEELWWDAKGRLRTHAPSTYKVPLASDRPRIFNVALTDWSEAAARTIKRSKAVGEPPFMLGISVFEAITMAIASTGNPKTPVHLDTPATPERVLMAVEERR